MGVERNSESLDLYNLSQLFLIRYQIKAGLIKTVDEYINNGTAQLFEMIADLHATCPETDWREVRLEAERIMSETRTSITDNQDESNIKQVEAKVA